MEENLGHITSRSNAMLFFVLKAHIMGYRGSYNKYSKYVKCVIVAQDRKLMAGARGRVAISQKLQRFVCAQHLAK